MSKSGVKSMKRSLVYVVFPVLFVFFVSGCVTQTVEIGSLNNYAGQNVNVGGCLSWECPTVLDAEFPHDCHVILSETNQSTTVTLLFDEATQNLRNMCNSLYNQSLIECVGIKATGMVLDEANIHISNLIVIS